MIPSKSTYYNESTLNFKQHAYNLPFFETPFNKSANYCRTQ